MSFWKTSGYDFKSFATLGEQQLLILISVLTREEIIEWLSWNDPNGIYDDTRSLKELGNIMTRDEGLEIMIRHIEESRV